MQLFSPETLTKLKQKATDSAEWSSLIARVDAWCASAHPMLSQSGGWIHNYICPTHWMPLHYDGNQPNLHQCPIGDTCEGDIYDEAWLAWRHREIADMSLDCAIAFAVTGNKTYLAEVERTIRHYTDFYSKSAGADSAETWMVKGRVFNQALTESLWAAPLLHAYDLVSDSLDASLKTTTETEFLRPLAETMAASQDKLIADDHVESNYMAWFNATLGCIGYILNEPAYIHRAIDGEGGFIRHLTLSTLPDGMQYEVTPYYHNFVVLAYQILAEAALANGRDLYAIRGEQAQSIQAMWRALPHLTLPDGTLADLADGSYWIESVYDRELIFVYEIARAHDDHPSIATTLHHAYTRSGRTSDHWAAWLFGKPTASIPTLPEPVEEPIQLLPSSGVAIMNASPHLSAVAPFGAYRGAHSHGDQLTMQVYPFSNDAACILYGIQERRDWYQSAYAHNGLIIDNASPKTFDQAHHQLTDNQITLEATDAFVANVSRTISIQDNRLIDQLTTTSDTPHQYDWLFHIDGKLESPLQFETIDQKPLAQSESAQFITIYAQALTVTQATFTIIHNDQTYGLNLQTEHPVTLYLATSPGNSWNPTQKRTTLIARSTNTNQQYKTEISHQNKDHG